MAHPLALFALAAGAFFLLGRKEGEKKEERFLEGVTTDPPILYGEGLSPLITGTGLSPSISGQSVVGPTISGVESEGWTPPSMVGAETGPEGTFYWILTGDQPAAYSIRRGSTLPQDEVEAHLLPNLQEAYEMGRQRAGVWAAGLG
jgi:hypothetical protein